MGPALILVTWVIWLFATIGVGLGLSSVVKYRPRSLRLQLHVALWWGLAAVLILVSGLNLLFPVGGSLFQSLSAVFLIGGFLLFAGFITAHRRTIIQAASSALSLRRVPTLLFLGLVGVALVLIARFAAAEPMDADTGGYRLGLINYAREFAVIPGLANLHDRFGFNSSLYPFAAFMEIGLWQNQGFRLVAGFLVIVLAADLLLRVAVPRPRGATPGDWYLVIASAFLMAIILTDSGRWIPSPAQDIAGYIPAVASTAFLADALSASRNNRQRITLLNLAVITAAVAGSLRPLGWLLAAIVVLVALGIELWHRPRTFGNLLRVTRGLLPSVSLSAVLAAVMLTRDALLTGWLLFPAGLLGLNVPWRVPNPSGTSAAITAWGRDPGAPASEVLEGFDWFIPWFSRFLESREAYLIGLMLIIGGGSSLLLRRGRRAWTASWPRMLVTLIPNVSMLLVWFVTAPDVRFGWAALVSVAAVPLSWLLATHAFPSVPVHYVGVAILVVMLGTQVANSRTTPRGAEPIATPLYLGPVVLTVNLGAPQQVETERGQLPDGTPVLFPRDRPDCWDAFPLCLMRGADPQVESIGDGIQDGFRPIRR